MKEKTYTSSEPELALSRPIVAHVGLFPQEFQGFPDLTDIIEALETFQNFEPAVRVAAIVLRASELGVSQLHFYAIALHAGLEVA